MWNLVEKVYREKGFRNYAFDLLLELGGVNRRADRTGFMDQGYRDDCVLVGYW